MKLYKFKSFINEVVTSRDILYPKGEIEHKGKKDPALYTWEEYFKDMQEGAMSAWHPDSAYNHSVEDDRQAYSWAHINDGNWKRLKSKKYDKITIDFYQNHEEHSYVSGRNEKDEVVYHDNKELNKKGKITKDYTIVAYHRDEDLIIGAAQDEWNSVLISVLKEYRGLGIADDLEDMYRHYFPHKGTGGVTNSGYKMLKRYHTRLVRKYLQNGIYSDMVRKGEITVSRAKEIVNSIEKKRYVNTGTEFSKNYGGSKELMYYINDSTIIIFDKAIKDAFNREEPERFTKKLIKCFIYANQFKKVDYENLFTVYAENEKFLKLGMDMLMSSGMKLSDYFLNKRFDDKTKEQINKVFEDSDYIIKTDKHYEHDNIVRIVSPKEIKYNFNKLEKDSNAWFHKNDQYEEFQNRLMEFAEGIADITA
jgi:hypothetical protein